MTRALWINVPFTHCLGFNPPNRFQHKVRKVNAADPRSVERFTGGVKQLLSKLNAWALRALQELQEMQNTKSPLKEVIALHRQNLTHCTSMKLKAADRCRQVYAGRWAWSPEWKQYKKTSAHVEAGPPEI